MLEGLTARKMELEEQLEETRLEATELEEMVQLGDDLQAEQAEAEAVLRRQLAGARQRIVVLATGREQDQAGMKRAREAEQKLGAELRAAQREMART